MLKKSILITLISICLTLNLGCIDRFKKSRRGEARILINKIHDLIKTGEFGKIYDDASPRIKECYSRDGFSEKMQLLVNNLKVEDPELNFVEITSDTEKADLFSSPSDLFVFGTYTVGNADKEIRESVALRNEEGSLKLFLYRVYTPSDYINPSDKTAKVLSTLIACGKKK